MPEEKQDKTYRQDVIKHRDDFMFMELFKQKEDVLVYDCTNVVYPQKSLKYIFGISACMILGVIGPMFVSGIHIPISLLMFPLTSRHIKWHRIFVEKVIYKPEEKEFLIYRRSLLGDQYITNVKAEHLVYTSDAQLNKKLINYINMTTLETYSIIYKNAWHHFDFFSFIIKQNAKRDLMTQDRSQS